MATIDTSKLSAVNAMLAMIGEAPRNSLTEGLTKEVTMAIATLDQISREVQSHGWHWNTDFDVEITRDADKNYQWQEDWIDFDLDKNQYDLDVARRGDRLYNVRKNTFDFTQSSLKGTAVIYLDWEELPEAARNFIMQRATVMLQDRIQGDEARHAYSEQDREEAWANLMQHELKQGDYNILDGGTAFQHESRRGADGLSYY